MMYLLTYFLKTDDNIFSRNGFRRLDENNQRFRKSEIQQIKCVRSKYAMHIMHATKIVHYDTNDDCVVQGEIFF